MARTEGVTDMKLPSTKHAFMLCAVLAALPGAALAGGGDLQVRDLAAASGLTPFEVKMVLGARTPYFEYLTSSARAEATRAGAGQATL
jgi:hypothetical protein